MGFTVEALTELRIGGERVVEDLDSDGAIEAGVACLVDLAPCRPRPAVKRPRTIPVEFLA
jgi:hypothetical protein